MGLFILLIQDVGEGQLQIDVRTDPLGRHGPVQQPDDTPAIQLGRRVASAMQALAQHRPIHQEDKPL